MRLKRALTAETLIKTMRSLGKKVNESATGSGPSVGLKGPDSSPSGTLKKGSSFERHRKHESRSWSPRRIWVEKWLISYTCHTTLGTMILINLFLLVQETDAQAKEQTVDPAVKFIDNAFAFVYLIEICLRVYVHRWEFFTSLRDLFDLSIVGGDIIIFCVSLSSGAEQALPSLSILRIFRLSRLAKIVRVLVLFPELHMLVKGLQVALRAITWGMVMLSVWLVTWSILAVQLIHPITKRMEWPDTCERCPRSFESVGQSLLTFTQTLLAGDGWGLVAVPIIEYEPWTYVFFLLVLMTISGVVMNLILAVIVDASMQARKEGDHEVAKTKRAMQESACERFTLYCQMMDIDGSGTLTIDEILNGLDEIEDLKDLFASMDISEKDMEAVFKILDEDGSGDVDYNEFIDQLHKMKSSDSHTLLIFIKHYVKSIHDELCDTIGDWTDEHVDMMREMKSLHTELKEDFSALQASLVATISGSMQESSGSSKPSWLQPWMPLGANKAPSLPSPVKSAFNSSEVRESTPDTSPKSRDQAEAEEQRREVRRRGPKGGRSAATKRSGARNRKAATGTRGDGDRTTSQSSCQEVIDQLEADLIQLRKQMDGMLSASVANVTRALDEVWNCQDTGETTQDENISIDMPCGVDDNDMQAPETRDLQDLAI